MEREELKKRKEILKACHEGKKLQAMYLSGGYGAKYEDIDPLVDGIDFEHYTYRIKQDPKYRPFKDAQEVFNEAKKHGFWIKTPDYYFLIGKICEEGIAFTNDSPYNANYDFNELVDFNWADDNSPCGILEE